MYDLIARSPNAEALRAEMHRDQLLREAATNRLARPPAHDGAPRARFGARVAARIREAVASVARPPGQDCPEGA